MVFAVLLMALTLGINVVLPKADAGATAESAQKSPSATAPAQAAQVAHSTQVN